MRRAFGERIVPGTLNRPADTAMQKAAHPSAAF